MKFILILMKKSYEIIDNTWSIDAGVRHNF